MYERFYQLRSRPFALSPDPDFLYPSRVHREALDYLRFAIEGHAGEPSSDAECGLHQLQGKFHAAQARR